MWIEILKISCCSSVWQQRVVKLTTVWTRWNMTVSSALTLPTPPPHLSSVQYESCDPVWTSVCVITSCHSVCVSLIFLSFYFNTNFENIFKNYFFSYLFNFTFSRSQVPHCFLMILSNYVSIFVWLSDCSAKFFTDRFRFELLSSPQL